MVELIVILAVVIGIYWAASSVFSLAGTVFGIIIPLMIWMGIGYIAGKLLRGKGYGLVGDVLLGLGGGLVGNVIFGWLNIGLPGVIGAFAAGVFGAVVLVFGIRLVHNSEFAS